MKTVFAFDYDNTISRDPTLFLGMMLACREQGHDVYVVTARRPQVHPEDFEWLDAQNFRVIKTRHIAKQKYMEEIEDIKVDVWVDDCPDAILNNWYGEPRTYREMVSDN